MAWPEQRTASSAAAIAAVSMPAVTEGSTLCAPDAASIAQFRIMRFVKTQASLLMMAGFVGLGDSLFRRGLRRRIRIAGV